MNKRTTINLFGLVILSLGNFGNSQETSQPTILPTFMFVAPSVPEDLETYPPSPTIDPTRKPIKTSDPSMIVSPTYKLSREEIVFTETEEQSIIDIKKKVINGPITSATFPTQIIYPEGGGRMNDKIVGGADNLVQEMKSETQIAIATTKYFLCTLVVFVTGFLVVLTVKR